MPAIPIQSKLPHLPPTIFSTMSQLAREYGAVNLGQGFPDYPMDSILQDLVMKAMRQGHNQYAHAFGNPALREVLAQKIRRLYGREISPETEITITPGGTYALSNAITALIRPGDEVILFEPAFDSYVPNIEVMGGIAIPIPLDFPGYGIPWDKVKSAITPKTRMVLINSPHNPTGTLISRRDLDTLYELIADTNILVLSDEVYEHLVFSGETHESVLRHPELWERSLVAFSLGKVFHCTGWKIGYTVAPAYLSKEFRNHHQFNVFAVNSPMQQAMAEYLENPDTYHGLGAFFEKKRDRFARGLAGLNLEILPSRGSYFQCIRFPESYPDKADTLANELVKKVGVASIPVSAFYRDRTDHRVLRFCFAKEDHTLDRALERLQQGWNGLFRN